MYRSNRSSARSHGCSPPAIFRPRSRYQFVLSARVQLVFLMLPALVIATEIPFNGRVTGGATCGFLGSRLMFSPHQKVAFARAVTGGQS